MKKKNVYDQLMDQKIGPLLAEFYYLSHFFTRMLTPEDTLCSTPSHSNFLAPSFTASTSPMLSHVQQGASVDAFTSPPRGQAAGSRRTPASRPLNEHRAWRSVSAYCMVPAGPGIIILQRKTGGTNTGFPVPLWLLGLYA